jgi:hypothetical protein
MTRWLSGWPTAYAAAPTSAWRPLKGGVSTGLASWTLILDALAREDAKSSIMGLEGRLDD